MREKIFSHAVKSKKSFCLADTGKQKRKAVNKSTTAADMRRAAVVVHSYWTGLRHHGHSQSWVSSRHQQQFLILDFWNCKDTESVYWPLFRLWKKKKVLEWARRCFVFLYGLVYCILLLLYSTVFCRLELTTFDRLIRVWFEFWWRMKKTSKNSWAKFWFFMLRNCTTMHYKHRRKCVWWTSD